MASRKNKQEDDQAANTARYPCVCSAIRKAGRVVTRQYDAHLKSSGLKVTQYSMLANVSRNPGITVSGLAELLFMDQTTVTRDLRVLEKMGYVRLEPGVKDRRIKRIQVTDAGMVKMNEARPLWEEAQREIEHSLGKSGIEGVLDWARKLAE